MSLDITDAKTWPLVLTLFDVSAIAQVSPHTLRKWIQSGRMYPAPMGDWPYRWHRAAVLGAIERQQFGRQRKVA